ncbi:MAG: FAD-binding oxidoreductase [Alicyclobacillus mali]|uniref:FAD-binding oxidoreductase n=1 Tax=Alicyclobacillus mali (ex Roth et al. 2021) TaxID=1123961 RepID=UPI0023F34597|nr:FAD-binding oxidoreductase [Alicyclobacillus mali (ex Roth et al. 2021)]MCL6488078.1 FAD-binding oxidoreductase [Alicyclobacillus mali (ex Roth et al. 2021)]
MPLQSKPLPVDTADALHDATGLPARAVPMCTVHPGESSKDTCAVEAKCEADVLAVLAYARELGLTVLPYGSGRHLAYGPPGEVPDLALTLRPMNRVTSFSPGDLVVSAEPGITIGELASVLAQRGLMLPFDPPAPADATLGGLLSTGLSGPRRALYGSLRDLAISLRVALADGRVIRTGAKVVKNVAGYDMTKLFIGACGTLGVVTEITLKLRPLPMHRETALVRGPAAALAELRSRIAQSTLVPSRIEMVGGADLGSDFVLAVDCDEPRSSAKAQTDAIRAMSRDFGLTVDVVEGEHADAWWSDLAQSLAERQVCIRLQGPPTSLFAAMPRALEAASALAERAESVVLSAGGLTGVARIAFQPARAIPDRPAPLGAIADLAAGASLDMVVERAPAEVRAKHQPTLAPASLALMQRLKHTFDPANLLSPGRFVGGM